MVDLNDLFCDKKSHSAEFLQMLKRKHVCLKLYIQVSLISQSDPNLIVHSLR